MRRPLISRTTAAIAGAGLALAAMLTAALTMQPHQTVTGTVVAGSADTTTVDTSTPADTTSPTDTSSAPIPMSASLTVTTTAPATTAAPSSQVPIVTSSAPVQVQAPVQTSPPPATSASAVGGPAPGPCLGWQCYNVGDPCPDTEHMMQAQTAAGLAIFCGDPAGSWVWMSYLAYQAWAHPQPTPTPMTPTA